MLLSVIKSISGGDGIDLDQGSGKVDELFKSLSMFKLLGVKDLPTKIEICTHSTDIALLENRTSEITWSTHMSSICDIVGNCSNLGTGALLIINGYDLEK